MNKQNYFVALETDEPDKYVIARSDDPEINKVDAYNHVSCVGLWLLPKEEALRRIHYMNGAFEEGVERAKKHILAKIQAGLAQW